ncbi:MAG: DNA methyltransferase [Candidatus Methanomethyliaceae archaeon]|nr:DNA methyltransferase [Candidatus Methanomethyliaceae archaeon]MDW7970525.1 DNA methyltransferase [Nitrososphaerota archaeon]
MNSHFFFKLFNSIKEEHEVDFAELELKSLFGEVKRVRNIFDIMKEEPFINFMSEDLRVQDIFTYELPYGKFHGFYGHGNNPQNIAKLVRRLAYTREIFLIIKAQESPSNLLMNIFPEGIIGKNVQFWMKNDWCLFRFITHQYFLEKSEYINKVSRNEREIDRNIEILMNFPMNELYRIPSSATMKIGKRLQDYFAIREEESLYLTHHIHPYKGKFHAKMCRALLNYVHPYEDGMVMDNFAGSGTLLLEACLMGINSIGVEINPLSVLMSNVKCFSLSLDYEKLKKEVNKFIMRYHQLNDVDSIEMPNFIKKSLNEKTIKKIILAKKLLNEINDEKIKEFLLLNLSGAISDAVRRRRAEFNIILEERLKSSLLRIYTFKRLNEFLRIKLGNSITLMADARDMAQIEDEKIDAIVTSPPYSTAINYIENDKFQLELLKLASLDDLARKMIGHPDIKIYDYNMLYEVEKDDISMILKEIIFELITHRRDVALRVYKFHKDMRSALREMFRVLKRGGKCAIIIGNNNYRVDGRIIEVKNDEIIIEMSEIMGFKLDFYLKRPLEKTSTGAIRYESIVILKKGN